MFDQGSAALAESFVMPHFFFLSEIKNQYILIKLTQKIKNKLTDKT